MGPFGQNEHFAQLSQKVCLYIHAVVLLRGLPSLECKDELFVGKTRKKLLAKSSQTDYSGFRYQYVQALIYFVSIMISGFDVWLFL